MTDDGRGSVPRSALVKACPRITLRVEESIWWGIAGAAAGAAVSLSMWARQKLEVSAAAAAMEARDQGASQRAARLAGFLTLREERTRFGPEMRSEHKNV